MIGPQVGYGRIVPDWCGAKNRAETAEILTHFNGEGRVLELFGGSGKATLYGLARERWWNDSDPALHRLAVAIRDDPLVLLATCTGLDPIDAWNERGKDRTQWTPEVVAAGAALSFGARMGGRAHTHKKKTTQWSSWVGRLPEVSRLMQGVILTCMDWRDALNAAQGWSVYADPPYENAANMYVHSVDNASLREELESRPVTTVLSGYDTPLDGWTAVRVANKPSRKMRQRAGERFGVEAMWVRT